MQETPRFTINRNLVVLLPRQPALDWILSVDSNPLDFTLAQIRHDQDAFLIPHFDEPEESARWIQGRWKMFFERFLMEWYTEESWWPQKRTLKMFNEWFEIQQHSMVWDLSVDEPIEHEDWESLGDD